MGRGIDSIPQRIKTALLKLWYENLTIFPHGVTLRKQDQYFLMLIPFSMQKYLAF